MPAGRAWRRNPVCRGDIARGDSEDVAGTARDAPRDARAFWNRCPARADRSHGRPVPRRCCRGVSARHPAARTGTWGDPLRALSRLPNRHATAPPRRVARALGYWAEALTVASRTPRHDSPSNERNSASELPVLVARLPQGRRSGFGESLVLAHVVESLRVRVAVPLASKARVDRDLIDGGSPEVGQPSLDVPAGHDHDDGISVLPRRNLLLFALRLQLRPTGISGTSIAVRDDDEEGPLPSPDRPQLGGIPCADHCSPTGCQPAVEAS